MGAEWADEEFPDEVDAAPQPDTAPGPAQPAAPAPAPFVMPRAAPPPPRRARAKAGLVLLTAAAGTGIGAVLGGIPGAGAGLLLSGAARNLYRGHAGLGSDDGESAKTLTIGVLGLAVGGYLVYRCFRKKD